VRALGLDLGAKRIGVAVSDRSGTIASPLTVIGRARNRSEDHHRIAALAREEEVELVVVGMPRSLSGADGPAARGARAEVEALASVVEVPVETWDERFTTVTAERALREGGVRGAAKREVVDKVAAAVILQGWLDAHRPGARS
jgi:putative holliday junction resolvase